MVSCGEEARLRNKKYIMVNLQQSNLQILKNTDCFLCLCVSLMYKVVQQVISSKFLLRLTINYLFLTSNVLFFPFFFLSDNNIQQNDINYSIAKMERNWMLSTQVFINQPFFPPKESLSLMNVVSGLPRVIFTTVEMQS